MRNVKYELKNERDVGGVMIIRFNRKYNIQKLNKDLGGGIMCWKMSGDV